MINLPYGALLTSRYCDVSAPIILSAGFIDKGIERKMVVGRFWSVASSPSPF